MQQINIQSIDDLVANASFKKWILLKDEKEALLWNQWLALHPERLEWVAAARTIVILLAKQEHRVSDQEVNDFANEIQNQILSLSETEKKQINSEDSFQEIQAIKPVSRLKTRFWWVAASVIVILTVGVLTLKPKEEISYNIDSPLFASNETGSLLFKNNTDSAQTILLPDSSEIVLEKGASIHYAGGDNLLRREAYLEGDAFFKIAHNPSKPFIVYTKKLVTKVLGTSFWIKASPKQKKAAVIVKTGKVSVFQKEKFTLKDTKAGVLEGLVLTPNQQVSYDESEGIIKKGLVSKPAIIEVIRPVNTEFDSTPALQVFNWLEKMYGVPIVLDEKAVASCSITASFGNESFFEKITIICKVIGATYEEIDGSIVISTKGCK
jgi:transmembrane sensor